MDQSFKKEERLKGRTAIDLLFAKGKSVSQFPLRLVYMPHEQTSDSSKIGVAVPKKYFKKAVDRNYYKRVMRELYRKNKMLLPAAQTYSIMMIYQSKDRLEFKELEAKALKLFGKFTMAVETVAKP